MCTHYAFTMSVEALRAFFNLSIVLEYPTRYNVAPNQIAPVIVRESTGNAPLLARWGFEKTGVPMRPVNARRETIATSPLFRESFEARRCIVPVSGFYEPRKLPGMKKGDQQWYFTTDVDILCLAGIVAPPTTDNAPPTFAVVTTEPNETVGRVHSRMPVMLAPESCDQWLDPDIDNLDTLEKLMEPSTPAGMKGHRVRMERVNRPAQYDGPECIELYDPGEEPVQGHLFGP